eukprot:CAMPEP_0116998484 /NCGR_PEP_ID=MMETSP0472-20121206/1539_1 /TAXON_ID=693140 ORGANISM="Tiarina fusus, Strain LIS" /NCGR_SAMPLE_ID=MMETSP0472 /ASSEMBLY_ACC=CAM_ASM_000603 /LENGTH=121 /DNA_ID=CAMNT_0004697649 /DNA_START=392 /DNA_END=754 /DNA_ORIENTATION=-
MTKNRKVEDFKAIPDIELPSSVEESNDNCDWENVTAEEFWKDEAFHIRQLEKSRSMFHIGLCLAVKDFPDPVEQLKLLTAGIRLYPCNFDYQTMCSMETAFGDGATLLSWHVALITNEPRW